METGSGSTSSAQGGFSSPINTGYRRDALPSTLPTLRFKTRLAKECSFNR